MKTFEGQHSKCFITLKKPSRIISIIYLCVFEMCIHVINWSGWRHERTLSVLYHFVLCRNRNNFIVQISMRKIICRHRQQQSIRSTFSHGTICRRKNFYTTRNSFVVVRLWHACIVLRTCRYQDNCVVLRMDLCILCVIFCRCCMWCCSCGQIMASRWAVGLASAQKASTHSEKSCNYYL